METNLIEIISYAILGGLIGGGVCLAMLFFYERFK